MTNDSTRTGEADPREEPIIVDASLLTEDQVAGLVDEYCTRFHGLNENESPLEERGKVAAAVRRRDLVVWFDPVENTAALGQKS